MWAVILQIVEYAGVGEFWVPFQHPGEMVICLPDIVREHSWKDVRMVVDRFDEPGPCFIVISNMVDTIGVGRRIALRKMLWLLDSSGRTCSRVLVSSANHRMVKPRTLLTFMMQSSRLGRSHCIP